MRDIMKSATLTRPLSLLEKKKTFLMSSFNVSGKTQEEQEMSLYVHFFNIFNMFPGYC